MGNFDSCLPATRNKNFLIVAAGVGSLYLAVKAYTVYKKSQQRKKWNAVGKNVIVLHQIVRGKNTPNISPFPLKLETYLRMANIPYEVSGHNTILNNIFLIKLLEYFRMILKNP